MDESKPAASNPLPENGSGARGRTGGATSRRSTSAETRERLLAAAQRIFARDGYGEAKIDDIVALLPATRATFYLHFRGKRDVALALVADLVADGVIMFQPPVDDVTPETLRAWLAELLGFWRANRDILAILASASAVDREMAALVEGSVRTGIGMLTSAIRRHTGDADAAVKAYLLSAQTGEFLRRTVVLGWPTDVDRALDLLAVQWCEAMKPAAAGPSRAHPAPRRPGG